MILRGLRATALALSLGGLASAHAQAQVRVQSPVTTAAETALPVSAQAQAQAPAPIPSASASASAATPAPVPAAAQTSSQRPSGLSVEFTAEERLRIASFGPWPPAPERDASNRVDGLPKAIALGQRLFSEPRLSASGQLACATCHDSARAFQDGQRFTRHGRNTPSLLDAGQRRWFGWDGANDSLWAASLQPLTAAGELAATPASVLALLNAERGLRTQYSAVFGPPQVDETLLVNVAKALAAYQATRVSPRTVFDDFRDALVRGEQTGAAAGYSAAAQRGLRLFVGPGRCFFCHGGPAFTNGEFADIGRPFFSAAGVDPGRWGGLQQLQASRYTRLGTYADGGVSSARASATRHVVQEPRHYGEFKVPGLRGLTATAPYFHDGSAATLDDVVRHYSELDESRLHADGARVLQALRLTPEQSADLVAFLRTLSEPAVQMAPSQGSKHLTRGATQPPEPSGVAAYRHPPGSSKR